MPRIDMTNWREYTVGKLFEVKKPDTVLHFRQVVEDDSGIPYVTRRKFNNGMRCRVRPIADVEPSPAGVISFGAENAACFYQEEPFLSGRDIYYVDTRGIPRDACLFLVACLQRIAKAYPYNFGLFPKQLKNERIFLPAMNDGTPDWDAMSRLMLVARHDSAIRLRVLSNVRVSHTTLDTSSWHEYAIGELFHLEKGVRLRRQDMKAGSIPFIGASKDNNGVTAHVGNDEHLHPGNTITVSYNGQKATGTAFWQQERYWASDDVAVLYPKFDLNRERALFLIPILRIAGEPYAFEDKWKLEYMREDKVVLPQGNGGEPDWAYIDRVMDAVCKRAEERLDVIQSVCHMDDVKTS